MNGRWTGSAASFAAIVASLSLLGCKGTEASTADSGVPTLAPTLSLVMPSAMTFTNGTVKIEVHADPQPDPHFEIDLLKNGFPFARVSAPFQFSWDTTYENEGPYDIEARPATGGDKSASVKVVVDRTPPKIVSQAPTEGSSNVSLDAPIRVVFSEPVIATTINAQSIALTLSGDPIATNVSVAADGKTVDVAIKSRAELDLPGKMSLTVSTAVTDLAGNTFANKAPAAWSVPLWLELNFPQAPLKLQKLAVTPDGSPIVAMADLTFAQYQGDGKWDFRSTAAPFDPSSAFSVAFDSTGNPWVAAPSPDGLGGVSVAHWSKTHWESPYDRASVRPRAFALGALSIVMDRGDRPLVGWFDYSPDGEGMDGYSLRRWDGQAWKAYGSDPIEGTTFAIGAADRPAILVGNETDAIVSRWTGSAWTKTARANVSPVPRYIFIDSQERVVVASQDGRVLRGDLLAELAPPLGETVTGVTLDSRDNPVVVKIPAARDAVFVARWTGTSWDMGLGSLIGAEAPNTPIKSAAIAIGADDRPIVAWSEIVNSTTEAHRIFVRKSNR